MLINDKITALNGLTEKTPEQPTSVSCSCVIGMILLGFLPFPSQQVNLIPLLFL